MYKLNNWGQKAGALLEEIDKTIGELDYLIHVSDKENKLTVRPREKGGRRFGNARRGASVNTNRRGRTDHVGYCNY